MGNVIGAWFERDVVRATGPDAAKFLQGQISQDVETLVERGSAWTLLLDPSGKLTTWMRITRVDGDEFLLDCAAGWSETMLTRLNRFKIRVACDFVPLDGWRMLSVRGATPDPGAVAADTVLAPAAGLTIGVVGYDLLGPNVSEPDGITLDEDAVEQYRIAHGIPEMGAELDETVIAAEIGAWFVEEAVSWTKGCYTGQELVARVDSRGSNTPRRLRSVELTAPAVHGDDVVVDGTVVGAITSVFGTAALARVGRGVAPPAAVEVGGHPATVIEIPGTTPPPAVVADEAPRRRSLI